MTTELLSPTMLDQAPLAQMSTEDLRRRLAQAIAMTAQAIEYLAAVWAELERRGDDLRDLRIGLAPFLPRIARGELAAELLIALAGNRAALDRLSQRPVPEQIEYARGAKLIAVVRERAGGKSITVNLPVAQITPGESRRAIADDGELVPPKKQKADLDLRVENKRIASRPRVLFDREADLVQIGSITVRRDYLLQHLRRQGAL